MAILRLDLVMIASKRYHGQNLFSELQKKGVSGRRLKLLFHGWGE